MTQQQAQLNVPATLVETHGTGEDTKGLIGKRIRITRDLLDDADIITRLIFGDASPVPVGSEGTVVHVDAEGYYWVDYGDDANIEPRGPEEVRVYDVLVAEDGEEPFFEIIE